MQFVGILFRFAQDGVSYFFRKKRLFLIQETLRRLPTLKIAVIYARYSSNRQTEQSIEGQLHVCQDYAKRNDILIVKNYIDRAMMGTNDNREAFQQMLKDSDKRP